MTLQSYAKKFTKSEVAEANRIREAACPLCGDRVHYRGFTHIECAGPGCPNFSPEPAPQNALTLATGLGDEPTQTLPATPAPAATGKRDVRWAYAWMTAGGRVEMRAKTLGNLGTWLPVFGVADLSQLQGSLPDADFDKLFDFRVP